MFFPIFKNYFKDLTFVQKIFFLIFKFLLKFMDIPLFPHFPLMSYAINFNLIVKIALTLEDPQKFIDFTLDASELYYYDYNLNSEIFYYLIILKKTPKQYKNIILLCFYILFFKTRRINFYYWIYAISLPIVFFFIFVYLDYLDGCFD